MTARRRASGAGGAGGGQGLVDYTLVLAGIALVTLVALLVLGDAVSAGLDLIAGVVDGATR